MACVCRSMEACQRHTPSPLAAVIGLSNNDVISLRCVSCVGRKPRCSCAVVVCAFVVIKAPPRDVTVLEKSSDTIRVQWSYADTAGVVAFCVLCRPYTAGADAAAAAADDDDDDDDDMPWSDSADATPTTSGTEYTLTGLQPLTVYQLRVVAVVDSLHTCRSAVVVCQTDQLPAALGMQPSSAFFLSLSGRPSRWRFGLVGNVSSLVTSTKLINAGPG